MFKKYEQEKQKLNNLKHEYELQKHHVETRKLELKYSPEYQKYKTIKEKEEQSILQTSNDTILLIDTKNKIRQQELIVEILRLEIEFEQTL